MEGHIPAFLLDSCTLSSSSVLHSLPFPTLVRLSLLTPLPSSSGLPASNSALPLREKEKRCVGDPPAAEGEEGGRGKFRGRMTGPREQRGDRVVYQIAG